MRIVLCVAAVVLLVADASFGKTFSRCELARELKQHGISDLRNWVCMAVSESGINTNKIGGPNRDGSRDIGIFQINDKKWCKSGRRGGDCNIRCEDLTDSNIADDIECAKKIHARRGFKAWSGWRAKCQYSLPRLPKCRGL